METKLNIYQRLNLVMKEVHSVKKDKDKKVNGVFSYVSHDQVSALLHMPLANAGIQMMPTMVSSREEQVLTKSGMTYRTTVEIDVHFINIDDPQDRAIIKYFSNSVDPQDKGMGKAISYATKYAQLKMFCLETGEDVDDTAIKEKYVQLAEHIPRKKSLSVTPEQKEVEKLLPTESDAITISTYQLKNVLALSQDRPNRTKNIMKTLGIKSFDQVPLDEYERVMKYLSEPALVTTIAQEARNVAFG